MVLSIHMSFTLFFTCTSLGTFLYVIIYVDDLIILGNDPSDIAHFKLYLSPYFYMKDLCSLICFHCIEIAQNASGLYLSHRKYPLDIF